VFAEEGKIIPQNGAVYPNGYAFQAISTFVVSITGLQVSQLQQWIYPLITALIVLPAWVLYRELTGSDRGAAITTMLLFTQPEFLFVILRSSHEKFTRLLMMVCLFLLARSFTLNQQTRKMAALIGLTYLTAFALITSNNLLASSFIFAIATAMLFGWLLRNRNPAFQKYNEILKRLAYTTLICLGLDYIFTYYVYYPPALHDLQVLGDVGHRIAALFLDVQTQPTNAYAQVSRAWVSLPIYFILSIANWILLVATLLIWLNQTWRWLWKREPPKTQMAWFLWLLYTAFAAQGALSVLSDATGALGGNLQHRIFPSFSMIAVAMAGSALADWRPRRFTKVISFGLLCGVFLISILSVMKATNEPLFSNKWTFYQPGELTALQWGDSHLESTEIWTDYDERLQTAYITSIGDQNNLFTTSIPTTADNLLLSSVTRLRSSRLIVPLPIPPDALLVYDNGIAQFYHVRPRSPYQR
jgi:hypothetical protein